jgi:hypothetical protein
MLPRIIGNSIQILGLLDLATGKLHCPNMPCLLASTSTRDARKGAVACLCSLLLVFYASVLQSAELPATYLSSLLEQIELMQSKLPMLSRSAEEAAAGFVAGGGIYAAGRQPDFISEACGRAGGLMCIKPLGEQHPGTNDVVLYAAPGDFRADDLGLIEKLQQNGATAIAFQSTGGLFKGKAPVDTVANVIGLWTWTGEFVGACTRLGKMPVLYKSYGLPGGMERGKKYEGKQFHDDLTVPAIKPGTLGKAYLAQLEVMVHGLQRDGLPKLHQAAEWCLATPATSRLTLVTGHMFPRHAQDSRAISFCTLASAPAWENKSLIDETHPPQFVLLLGYQSAPQKLLDLARSRGFKLVYSCVEPGQMPLGVEGVMYIRPGWPLTDACVNVPGYDIPILPASGVVHAAIYWSIASGA